MPRVGELGVARSVLGVYCVGRTEPPHRVGLQTRNQHGQDSFGRENATWLGFPFESSNISAANGDGEFNGLGPGRQSLVGHRGLLIRIVTTKAYGIVECSNPEAIVCGYHFRALNSALWMARAQLHRAFL